MIEDPSTCARVPLVFNSSCLKHVSRAQVSSSSWFSLFFLLSFSSVAKAQCSGSCLRIYFRITAIYTRALEWFIPIVYLKGWYGFMSWCFWSFYSPSLNFYSLQRVSCLTESPVRIVDPASLHNITSEPTLFFLLSSLI